MIDDFTGSPGARAELRQARKNVGTPFAIVGAAIVAGMVIAALLWGCASAPAPIDVGIVHVTETKCGVVELDFADGHTESVCMTAPEIKRCLAAHGAP